MFILSRIKQRIGAHHELNRILANAGWLLGDRILRMGIGLFVSIWVARYLGVENFGLLSFASALVALLQPFSRLGLKDLVVRSLVSEPENREEILGTAFGLKLVGGFLTLFLAAAIAIFLRESGQSIVALVSILGAVGIFQSFETIELWFQSQLQSKYSVLARNSAYVVVNLIKVFLIKIYASLTAFAWASLAAPFLGGLFLLVAYHLKGYSFSAWRWNIRLARNMLKESWPLALSGFTVVVYMKIDSIMIGQLIGSESVGLYSSASRIAEAWYFIPTAIAASVSPGIYSAKRESNQTLYIKRLSQSLKILSLISISIAFPVSLLSREIMSGLYGPDYIEAGPILSIYVWAALFVFIGIGSSAWFIAEGLTSLTFRRTLIGAIFNIGLNYFLIPLYGGIGAAISTVFSQAFASFLSNAFTGKTRPLFIIQLKSLVCIK